MTDPANETTYCIEWEAVGLVNFLVNHDLVDSNFLFNTNNLKPGADERIADSHLDRPVLEAALKVLADSILREHLFFGYSKWWISTLDGRNGIKLLEVDTSFASFDDFYISQVTENDQ